MGCTPHGCPAPSEVTQQIKYEQNDEYQAKAATASDMPAVSIATASEEENKDNNNEDEGHNNMGWRVRDF